MAIHGTVLKEFAGLRQGHSRLRVRVVQLEGLEKPRLDIRQYVESPDFQGFTRKGVSLTEEMFDELLRQTDDIKAVFSSSHDGNGATKRSAIRSGGA